MQKQWNFTISAKTIEEFMCVWFVRSFDISIKHRQFFERLFFLFLIVEHVNYGDLCEMAQECEKPNGSIDSIHRMPYSLEPNDQSSRKKSLSKIVEVHNVLSKIDRLYCIPSHRRNRFYPLLISITFEV